NHRVPSEGRPVVPQKAIRLDRGAVIRSRTDLEVEMRPGRVPGGTGQTDLLTGPHGLPHGHRHRRQVRVLRVRAVTVLDDDGVAVRGPVAAAVRAGLDDRAAVHRLDAGAGGDDEILAAVLVGPVAAVDAEG